MSESAFIDDSIIAEIRPHRENEEKSPQGPGELLTYLLRMVRTENQGDSSVSPTPQPTQRQGPLAMSCRQGLQGREGHRLEGSLKTPAQGSAAAGGIPAALPCL